jgi:hypothetical protein
LKAARRSFGRKFTSDRDRPEQRQRDTGGRKVLAQPQQQPRLTHFCRTVNMKDPHPDDRGHTLTGLLEREFGQQPIEPIQQQAAVHLQQHSGLDVGDVAQRAHQHLGLAVQQRTVVAAQQQAAAPVDQNIHAIVGAGSVEEPRRSVM